MEIDLSKLRESIPKLRESVPIILGGAIYFLTAFTLLSMWQWIIYALFRTFGIFGLLTFIEEIRPALVLFMIAIIHLPSGFLGGLYAGYKMKENLRIILIYPSVIGVTALAILQIAFGAIDLSLEGLGREVFLPLLGSILGSYLGGYTMNWETEEEF